LGRGIRVEIDDFAICKTDTEAFLYKHVAVFFFRKGGFAPATVLRRGRLLERCFVVDQLRRLGKADSGTRLARNFVVGCKLRAIEPEESAAPVLLQC
jgi:hypothetical protein